MTAPIQAWHFLPNDGRLRYGRGKRGAKTRRGHKVRVGETLTVSPPLKVCAWGLHASLHVFDALMYAHGSVLCRVELSGEVLHGNDKLCAENRKVIWMADVPRLLHEFALWCAWRAVRGAGVTDSLPILALETKQNWLDGCASNDDLRAIRHNVMGKLGPCRVPRGSDWYAALDAVYAATSVRGWEAIKRASWYAATHTETKIQRRELARRVNQIYGRGKKHESQ